MMLRMLRLKGYRSNPCHIVVRADQVAAIVESTKRMATGEIEIATVRLVDGSKYLVVDDDRHLVNAWVEAIRSCVSELR